MTSKERKAAALKLLKQAGFETKKKRKSKPKSRTARFTDVK